MVDYAKKGFAIDALVASVAQGWELAKKFNTQIATRAEEMNGNWIRTPYILELGVHKAGISS